MKPEHRHLCAIATAVITRDNTITDAEWIAGIKDRIVRQRVEYPAPHDLTAAIRAVERALARTDHPRPAPVVPGPPPPPPDPGAPPWDDQARGAFRKFMDAHKAIGRRRDRGADIAARVISRVRRSASQR